MKLKLEVTMNRKILILLFIIFHLTSFIGLKAQDTWIQTYDPFTIADFYHVEDVVMCQDSGYAVNGFYYFDDGMGYEEQWGFLMKTDCDGNMQWVDRDTLYYQFENESLAFIETSDGGFISAVTGGYLIKRDANGNREWVIPGDFGINSMCNTSDGNIILGGGQNLNIGLRKIDEQGDILWTQVYPIGDDSSICKSIIQTQDGGFALTGYLDYEGRPDADILVMKTDVNGDSLWTQTYDSYGFWDMGNCIIEDSSLNLMISGLLGNPNSIGFIWFLNEFGNTIWLEEVNENIGYEQFSVLENSNEEFVAYCNFSQGIKIFSFDNNYNIIFETDINGWSALGDRGFRELQNEGYIIGGISVSDWNIMLIKTDSVGNVSLDNNIFPNIKNFNLFCYPNPFNPSTTIQFSLPFEIVNPIIEIFNIKGQLVEQIVVYSNQSSIEWNAVNLASGIYFYRIKGDNQISQSKKMILLK